MPAMRLSATPRSGLIWLALFAACLGGCQTTFGDSASADVANDSLIQRAGVFQIAPPSEKDAAALAAAHELYKTEKFSAAEGAFHHLAEKCKHPKVAEEARFFEAESLRRQLYYPKACDTYNRLLIDFAAGVHRTEALDQMYKIALFWLEDTWKESAQAEEVKAGKRWMVTPAVCHFERWKPFLDEEGRALQALENVYLADLRGPLGEKALHTAGRIKLYRQDYKEADHYFTLQLETYPNGPLSADAIEGAIFAKHMSTGGPDYDNRKSAEAYNLIKVAQTSHPNLINEKGAMLDRQMVGIHLQAAQRDLNTAEFYRRTSHPGSAYFCYEIVRRRYPGTKQAEQAEARMIALKEEVEKEQARLKEEGKNPPFWMQMFGQTPAPPARDVDPKAKESFSGTLPPGQENGDAVEKKR